MNFDEDKMTLIVRPDPLSCLTGSPFLAVLEAPAIELCPMQQTTSQCSRFALMSSVGRELYKFIKIPNDVQTVSGR